MLKKKDAAEVQDCSARQCTGLDHVDVGESSKVVEVSTAAEKDDDCEYSVVVVNLLL